MYAPPQHHNLAPPPDEDFDLVHVNPTFPKIAAGFTLLSGVLGILNAVQTLLSVRIYSTWSVMPYVLIVLGAALVYLAKNLFTARRWAAIGVLAIGALLGLASTAWLYFAVTNGFIALYALWTPMGALVSVVLASFSIPACDRATIARQRLAAQGMNLGL
jgi:hypothetical protein